VKEIKEIEFESIEGKENFYELGGHLHIYDDPEFWKKFDNIYVVGEGTRSGHIETPEGKLPIHEPPEDLLAAAIAAVRVPEEKIRKYLAELPEYIFYEDHTRFGLVSLLNPELSRKEVDELSQNDEYYKKLVNSLSEDDLRWVMMAMQAVHEAAIHEAIKPTADIRDVYELAIEYYKNTKNQGFRNWVLHQYDSKYCKLLNHEDEIQRAHARTESIAFELPELTAYVSAVYGKKLAEMGTIIAGTILGTKVLERTFLGDLSQEIFKEVLKESPNLATKPSVINLFLNSHTILPLIVAAGASVLAAYAVGNAIEKVSVEAGSRAERGQFDRISREIESVRGPVEESLDKAYEILKSRGPYRFTESKAFVEYFQERGIL